MDNRIPGTWKIITWLALCSILLSGLLLPAVTHAQSTPPPEPMVQVASTPAGAEIAYTAPLQAASLETMAAALPLVQYQGYRLPMQVLVFTQPIGANQGLQVQQIAARALETPLEPSAAPLPPALDWQPDPNAPVETPQLPTQPVFILRQGLVHGQMVTVVAVSPIFAENGVQKLASSFQVFIPQAAPAAADLLTEVNAAAARAPGKVETVNVPVNQAALATGYRIVVNTPGMQEVSYSAVGAQSGAALQLTYAGQTVAIEKLADTFRFYAPTAGDRWNSTSTYWLAASAGAAAAPATTAGIGPAPSTAQLVDAGAAAGTAYERGAWVDNLMYNSNYPGGDGDHWFHAAMQVATGAAIADAPMLTATVTAILPAASGVTSIFASVKSIVNLGCFPGDRNYHLGFDFLQGGVAAASATQSWNPAPDCRLSGANVVTATTNVQPQQVLLRLLPNSNYTTNLLLDKVAWERPVALDFTNVPNGAEFWTHAGAATYSLSNLPSAWHLYNVTDPLVPTLVASGAGGGSQFSQGAAAPISHYALVGAAQIPAVAAHAAVNFGDVKAANAIYIGPANFAAGLGPLISLRQQQGFAPLFVDVQSIYDVYGDGQISGTAIRNFLRDKTDWQNTARKISVVMVGDSTYDPFAYEGKQNSNLVAPYMADVDRFIHEVPCEQCYAQLNGDDPTTGDNLPAANGRTTAWFAADIWVGRFPVRTEAELAAVVQKIVAYDTTGSDDDLWRSRYVFLADNYIKALDANQNALIDDGGDFPALSDAIVAKMPAQTDIQRIYYDPAPQRVVSMVNAATTYLPTKPRSVMEPWRIDSPTLVNAAVIGAMNGGAALVTYNGHSHHWQYAITSDSSIPSWLFYINDAEVLNNRDKLFIALSMTCYTSQFTKPATNGTVDEVLFRHANGGAVATWGSSGLSVVEGHDLLQKGFMDALWSKPAGDRHLGALFESGYTTLLTKAASESDMDALKTFMLFGDPLTKARVGTSATSFAPIVKR